MLCKTMRGIDRPSLQQLNETIVSNICPMLLPKHCSFSNQNSSSTRHHLIDDITHLCCHPGYKFLDIKVTPQTSNKSIEFTYDSWNTLLRTVQQLQLSGSASERNIKASLKHALQQETTSLEMGGMRSRGVTGTPVDTRVSMVGNVTPRSPDGAISSGIGAHNMNTPDSMRNKRPDNIYPNTRSPSHISSSVQQQSHEEVVRSLASIITLHGVEACEQASQIQRNYDQMYCNNGSNSSNSAEYPGNMDVTSGDTHSLKSKSPSVGGAVAASVQRLKIHSKGNTHSHSHSHGPSYMTVQPSAVELQIHETYYQAHSSLMAACGNNSTPIRICASDLPLNGYQRATSVLSNSQAVLPLLQRAARGGAELYEAGAYLHQYSTYGIEDTDFQQAFRTVGCSIRNYLQL